MRREIIDTKGKWKARDETDEYSYEGEKFNGIHQSSLNLNIGSQYGIYDILNIKGCPGTDSLLSDAFRSVVSLEDDLFDWPTEDSTQTPGSSSTNTSAQDVDATLADSLSKSLHIDVEGGDVHMHWGYVSILR